MAKRITDALRERNADGLRSNPPDGSTTYSFSIPRQALRLLRERYGENNTGAVIRGLIANELGTDWPQDECCKKSAYSESKHKLKVIRPGKGASL